MAERAELEIVITDNPQNQQTRTPVPFVGEQPEQPAAVTSPVAPPPFPPSSPRQETAIVPDPKKPPDTAVDVSPPPGRDIPEWASVGGQKINLNDPANKAIAEAIRGALAAEEKTAPTRPQPVSLADELPAASKAISGLAEAAEKAREGFAFWFKGRKFGGDGEIDVEAEAAKLVQMEERRAKLKAAYDELAAKSAVPEVRDPTADIPEAKPVDDPRMVAMRRINAEKQGAINERAYNQAKFGQDTDPKADRRDLGQTLSQGGMLAAMGGFPRLGTVAGSAGQMMAASGGMGVAAGGVGLALAVQHAVSGAIRDTMQAGGRMAAKAGALDGGVLPDAVQGVNEFFGKLSIGNMIFAESIKIVRGFNTALEHTARQLGEFNPSIAMAEAQSDIRRIFGDIRRGQQLGPGLARVVDANSRLGEAGRDALTALLKPIIPRLATLMEKLAELVENKIVPAAERGGELLDAGLTWYEAQAKIVQAIYQFLTGDWTEANGSFEKAQGKILDVLKLIAGNTQPPPPTPLSEDAQFPTLDEGTWSRFGPELWQHFQPNLQRRKDQRAFNPVP